MESAAFSCQNQPCDITGCLHAGSAIDFLLFSLDVVKFILHIVVMY